jgi:hypothetical protein
MRMELANNMHEVDNILIDAKCLQAMQHLLGTGETRRLTTFIATLESLGKVRVGFSQGLPFKGPDYAPRLRASLRLSSRMTPWLFRILSHELLPDELENCELLILTTRFRLCPYSALELDAIDAFLQRGGSLWMMTNHSRVPGTQMWDFTTEDGRLANRLGVKIRDACFRMPGGLARLDDAGETAHEVLLDDSGHRSVEQVVVNNCSAFSADGLQPVLYTRSEMIDDGPQNMNAHGQLFAATTKVGRGRVLVTGDSGFVCEPNVPGSGPGLIDKGDNLQFILNAARWLLGRR